jgi:hypothetical protein
MEDMERERLERERPRSAFESSQVQTEDKNANGGVSAPCVSALAYAQRAIEQAKAEGITYAKAMTNSQHREIVGWLSDILGEETVRAALD